MNNMKWEKPKGIFASIIKNKRRDNFLRLAIFPIVMANSLGCKEDISSSINHEVEENINIHLTQATFNVSENEGFLDLTPYIKFERKTPIKSNVNTDIKTYENFDYELDVTSSAGLEQQCFVNSQVSQGFYFSKVQEACVYDFTVHTNSINGESISRTSKVRVISSSEDDVLLPPTSHVMTVGEQEVLLISTLPQGYALDEIVAIDGQASASVTSGEQEMTIDVSDVVQSDLSIIEYIAKPKNNQGAMFDSENIEPVKMGQVYVTTQEQGYISVSAGSGHLPSDSGMQKDYPLDTEIIIDISPFVDAGTFDYQLFEVKSLTADVRPVENNNKSFSFKADQQGRHYVYYMVYDSTVSGTTAGGYSGNVITIDVAVPKGWTRLVNENHKIFSAPPTYHEVLSYDMDRFSGFQLNSYFDEGVERHIAAMPKSSASNYCNFVGGTPLNRDIDGLIASDIVKQYGWPLDLPYTFLDINLDTNVIDYRGVDFKTGQIFNLTDDELTYATCQQTINVNQIGTTTGNTQQQTKATLTLRLDEYYPVGRSRLSESSPLIAEVTSGFAQLEGQKSRLVKYSNNKGEITFYFSSDTPGESQIKITNPNSSRSRETNYTITFE
ncbi:hypothetical protein ACQKQC_24940 [Vibrio fortis]|uniref:hypothetical protein n=1 Tax=Vibrio fortis TaxID=212667 RepID=UPI00406799E2